MGGGLRPSKRESAMEQTMGYPTNNTGSPTPVRRKYSAEFKASVVEQCSQPGNTTAAVAKHHGIHVSLVRRWAQLMRQAAQSNAAQQEEQQAVESWTGASPDAPQTETSTATARMPIARMPDMPAPTPTPAWVAGRFCVIAQARRCLWFRVSATDSWHARRSAHWANWRPGTGGCAVCCASPRHPP